MESQRMVQYKEFMETLQYCEPAIAAYYSDKRPNKYNGPIGGFFRESHNVIDALSLIGKALTLQNQKKTKFQCMFHFLAHTRSSGVASVFDEQNFGCPGCRFYMGFVPRFTEFNSYFSSAYYASSPHEGGYGPCSQSSEKYALLLDNIQPKGTYLIFEPFDKIEDDIEPEVVIFFANPEIIACLVSVLRFVSDQIDVVQSPCASGCASLFSWPIQYKMQGQERAVLGVFDVSARPYLSLAEMSLSIQYSLFIKMISSYRESFLCAGKEKNKTKNEMISGWNHVQKRAQKVKELLDCNTKNLSD